MKLAIHADQNISVVYLVAKGSLFVCKSLCPTKRYIPNPDYWEGCRNGKASRLKCKAKTNISDIEQRSCSPPIWNRPKLRVQELRAVMPREAEAHEPLPV